MSTEWKSEAFRASLVRKLEEAVRESGIQNQKSARDLENQVFQRSNSKEDYLGYVAKLILHIKSQRNKQAPPDQQQSMGGMNTGMQQQQQHMMGMQQQQQQQNRMQMRMPVSQQQQMMMHQQQMQAQIRNRMQQPGQQGMQPGTAPPSNIQQTGVMQQQSTSAMSAGNIQTSVGGAMHITGPGQPGMPGGQRMSLLQQSLQHRAQGMSGNYRGGVSSGAAVNQGQAPAPAPAPYHAQSPQGQINLNQASPHAVPSPGQRAGSLAPSPSSQVNTPMNPVNQEEREYLDKLKSLEKYIEPLRRVIRRHGNEENEKLGKMKKLLDILSNPDKRVPLVTLQKCEDVLKRMQLDTTDTDNADINLQANPDKNPLIDAVLKLQHNSKDGKGVSLNNSLANTFVLPVETVLGPAISLPPLPRTPPALEEHSQNLVPDLLQGEIARLDPRFEVSLDRSQPQYACDAVELVCQLQDKHLPAVPQLRVSIPANYPNYPPQTNIDNPDYLSTPFLKEVTASLTSRLDRMPPKFTLSQLLTAWELSVRAACPPSHIKQMNQQTPLFTL